ncbi:hypothetical protein Ctha_0639 [Chloroherpeton thalassium ATCC 35110]|uniref:Chromosome segregation ATPase-like protein n=1 Tax=Chloroherpeton thalassium (strain ATCC 35110 / GB-78) TaxID=517418 RepID=B3QVQ2_CHLT3|nr:DUF4175 family protein [Chloroherpeton thalassium]ACF13109.1 hypothetical protein Ctha_0639 [Chloroherpeton thalassium ATCC 35110]
MPETRNDIYAVLTERLRAVFRKEQQFMLLGGAMRALAAIFGLALSVALSESIFRFSGAGRLRLLVFFASGVLFAIGGLTLWPVFRHQFHLEDIAKKVGVKFPVLHDKLLNALQIFHDTQDAEKSNPFAEAELERVEKSARNLDFLEAVGDEKLKKNAVFSGAILFVISVCFAMFHADLGAAVHRLQYFDKEFILPDPFKIISLSKNIEITKGNDALLRFRIAPDSSLFKDEDDAPEVRKLNLKLVDLQGFELQKLTLFADSSRHFSYKLRSQKKSVVYFAESKENGDRLIKSEKYQVNVVDRPRVENFRVSIFPPAYSRRPRLRLEENFGDASALVGSKILIEAEASKPLETARLILNDSLLQPMSANGSVATVRFSLKNDLSYQFWLKDSLGFESEKSATYQLRALYDEPPEIRVLQPEEKQVDLPRSLAILFVVQIQDDYGFKKLAIRSRLAKSEFAKPSENFSETLIPLKSGISSSRKKSGSELILTVPYNWDLSRRLLSAGDEIEFYGEVTDNDAVSGFKTARTELYRLRLPTLDELFTDVEKKEDSAFDEVEKQIEKTKAVQRRLETVQNDLRQKREADWQDRKQIEETLRKQAELEKNVESLAQELEKLMKSLEKDKLASDETLQKYMEVQRLMSEINSPELQQAMQKMQEALKKMNDAQIREALKNFSFNEEQVRKRLERTLELLKRVQIERKFDELNERLSQMIEKEESLREQAERGRPDDAEKLRELEKEQSALNREQEAFEREFKELEEKLRDFPRADKMPLAELDSLKKMQQRDDVPGDMQQAEQNLQKRNPQAAAKKQQSAIAKMQKQREKLSEMKSMAQLQNKKQVMEALKNAAQSAIVLSMEQELLRDDFSLERGDIPTTDEMRRQAGEQQAILENVQLLKEIVTQVGKKSTQLGSRLTHELNRAETHMQEAISLASSRNAYRAKPEMTAAMEALNKFADQTGQTLSQMMQQQGQSGGEGDGSDMMQQMRNLSDKQGGLNQQTESAMGERLQMGQGERMLQLAAQQRMIQEQLRKLQERQMKNGESKLLGDLGKMLEDMEQVARKLEQQDLSSELIKRQQQILSRMLESTTALRKQGFEENREALAGKDIFKKTPQELQSEDRRSRLQDAINRLKEQGFSDDYRKLIQRYYESLEKDGL